MQKEKFMIYRRDAKKGEATYSPKSHSAPHFVGHYVEGLEEWASWYCFNKKEDGTYEAFSEDGQRVGGAIITVNGVIGELAFLYVKVGVQSKGIGQSIWKSIESMHPEIEVWETCTPYFDRRNIHFYINRCGFHAVEFFNEHHPDPHMPEQFDQEDGLFKFEKKIR